jgi:uncharacterized protein
VAAFGGFCHRFPGNSNRRWGWFLLFTCFDSVFQVPAPIAVSTSLAATLPVCIVGALGYYRNGNVDLKTGTVFAISGILGALIGANLTGILSTGQLKISFGVYSILLAVHMMLSNRRKIKAEALGNKIPVITPVQKKARGSGYGLLAGVITGTFGTSATAPVIAGLFAVQLPIKAIAGTSLTIVFVNTIFALGAHFMVGKIDLTLVYFLTAGTILGAFAGPRLMNRVEIGQSENSVRFWFALVMMVFGILMIIA